MKTGLFNGRINHPKDAVSSAFDALNPVDSYRVIRLNENKNRLVTTAIEFIQKYPSNIDKPVWQLYREGLELSQNRFACIEILKDQWPSFLVRYTIDLVVNMEDTRIDNHKRKEWLRELNGLFGPENQKPECAAKILNEIIPFRHKDPITASALTVAELLVYGISKLGNGFKNI